METASNGEEAVRICPKGAISLEDKISLVDALSDTGVASIEFTSFVSPKWVPQMADAEQMVAGITRAPGVAYEAIWLNEAGLERAAKHREALALRPMFSVAGSDTFMRKNTNRSVDERLDDLTARQRQSRLQSLEEFLQFLVAGVFDNVVLDLKVVEGISNLLC